MRIFNTIKSPGTLSEPAWFRWIMIFIAVMFLGNFILLTLAVVFYEAFKLGYASYLSEILNPETLNAIKLTLITAAVSVALNTVFGICAAWLITKYEFKGKRLLLTLLDLPYTISPVISGMMFVLLLGSNSFIGNWLNSFGIKIIFAVPGIIIATTFVTFPYIARELIPHMLEQGSEEEEAAVSLGAGGWITFFKVTLPNIKWSLMYGLILCNARAIGEFGAVSVVSGHIRGLTNTMPLHIEILYNEYNFVGSFAVSSLLTLLALLTLITKSFMEWKQNRNSAAEVKES